MPKDSPIVSLDALIPREAFEIQGQQSQNIGRNVPMISIRDLEQNSFFYPSLRKPDFQRETGEQYRRRSSIGKRFNRRQDGTTVKKL
jgi:hypothetical protein